jgi:hypothetical protein
LEHRKHDVIHLSRCASRKEGLFGQRALEWGASFDESRQ